MVMLFLLLAPMAVLGSEGCGGGSLTDGEGCGGGSLTDGGAGGGAGPSDTYKFYDGMYCTTYNAYGNSCQAASYDEAKRKCDADTLCMGVAQWNCKGDRGEAGTC